VVDGDLHNWESDSWVFCPGFYPVTVTQVNVPLKYWYDHGGMNSAAMCSASFWSERLLSLGAVEALLRWQCPSSNDQSVAHRASRFPRAETWAKGYLREKMIFSFPCEWVGRQIKGLYQKFFKVLWLIHGGLTWFSWKMSTECPGTLWCNMFAQLEHKPRHLLVGEPLTRPEWYPRFTRAVWGAEAPQITVVLKAFSFPKI
jgi:hypothetical protein